MERTTCLFFSFFCTKKSVPLFALSSKLLLSLPLARTPEMARLFVACINSHGGNAQLMVLPGIGVKGNCHFLFAEKDNVELAGLSRKRLEKELPCFR